MKVIPRSWDGVTVEKFQLLSKTFGETPQTESEALTLTIKRACYLTDLEYEEVVELPMDELMKVNDLLKLPLPTKLPRWIRHYGNLYKVRLDPTKENAKVHLAIMNSCKDEGVENMHKVMYLACKPVKSIWRQKELKLDPMEVEKRMNQFKTLPISLVNPVVVFFYSLTNKLINASLEYSDEKMKEMNQILKEQTDLLEDMAG